jgi:hypothetical protein
MWEPPLFTRLAGAHRVLIAGAGGGFDIFAGLPLALGLRARGREVFLANLSFTALSCTDARQLTRSLFEVDARTTGEDRYFPERTLARWLHAQGLPDIVYAFDKVGVRPLRAGYEALVRMVRPDAIVLVDGGTDLLMRGDEAGLGTPEEDMTSLAAIAGLTGIPVRIAACIGFGIDAYHGVCHAHFLENVAALAREGAYLGAFSVPADAPEARAFLDAIAAAQAATPGRPSIVNGQIAAAIRGEFGDVQFTPRTAGSELFVNPLMALYFAFELEAVARRSLYLAELEDTETIFQVSARIEVFRHTVAIRPRRAIPH